MRLVGSSPVYIHDGARTRHRTLFSCHGPHARCRQNLGMRLGVETYREHGLIWAKHRTAKGEVAELLEHRLGAALTDDGDDATNIRAEWLERGWAKNRPC